MEEPKKKKRAGRPKTLQQGRIFSFYLDDISIQNIEAAAKKYSLTKSDMARIVVHFGLVSLLDKENSGELDLEPAEEKLDQPDPADQVEKEPSKEEEKTQEPQAVPVIPQPNISTVGRHF